MSGYFSRKSGLPWLLRKIFLFLTYPFRHWLLLLFVLAVLAGLYCVPVYWYKVPQDSIVDWYKGKFIQLKQIKLPETEKKGTDELVYVESPAVATVGRRGFGQAGAGGIQRVDILSQEANDVVEVENEVVVEKVENLPVKTEVAEPQKEIVVEKKVKKENEEIGKFVYEKGEYSGLKYLDTPKKIEGTANIVNANELVIDDTFVFLYGVYVNPRTEQGVKTSVVLKKLLNGKKVVCNILAYTKIDKTATAECFADGDSINQYLVERGYSKRVAAK